MNMKPVPDWIKNIINHAIHGNPRPPSSSSSSSPAAAPSRPQANASASANENDVCTPLLASLACALRGDLAYTCPEDGWSARPRADDSYRGLAAAAALAPAPCRDPTLRQTRRVGLRREMLGDRKLRVARLLMETATAGRTWQRHGDGAAGVAGYPQQQTAVSALKARRLLALSTGVFGRRCPGGGGGGGGGGGTSERAGEGCGESPPGQNAQHTRPPLSVGEDILPLVRPAYSLLGEALLGDAGLARRLAPEAVAVASALAVAGLDYTLRRGGQEGKAAALAADERRAARCFAEVVVLAVSTHLGMVLASVRPTSADGGAGGEVSGDGGGLADLGPRESHLEQLLESLGAWESHGGGGRGWPHSSLPAVALETSSSGSGGQSGTHAGGDGGIPLQELLKEVESMVADLRSTSPGGEMDEEIRRLLDSALVPRLEDCRACFQQLPGSGGLGSTAAV